MAVFQPWCLWRVPLLRARGAHAAERDTGRPHLLTLDFRFQGQRRRPLRMVRGGRYFLRPFKRSMMERAQLMPTLPPHSLIAIA